MNRKNLVYLALVIALGFGAYFANVEIQTRLGTQALAKTGLTFLSLDEALHKAQTDGKPVLVDFSAIWCPTCRTLHEQVFTDAKVKAAINAQFVLARVDYESPEAAAFMARYDVHGFPTLLVLKADGALIRSVPVSMEPQTFLVGLSS
jgi:thiol:disulfide interchange protein